MKRKKDGSVYEASFYYRDLDNGPWVGINLEEKYIGASLLKLGEVIGVYKLFEDYSDKSIYNKEYVYNGDGVGVDSLDRELPPLIVGGEYSISDLAYRSLAYSDNFSTQLISKTLSGFPQEYRVNVGKDIQGLTSLELLETGARVSPKQYMSLFRILYNASFLSRRSSEEILEIMSQATFHDGISSGSSSKAVISHKFGIYKDFIEEDGSKVGYLHDCGIVYHPKKVYGICVMTKGSNIETQAKLIQDIAKSTSAYVESIK